MVHIRTRQAGCALFALEDNPRMSTQIFSTLITGGLSAGNEHFEIIVVWLFHLVPHA
jgi:hypothetical protein